MPFEKIETKKKSAYIIEQIVGAIRDGEYSIGQKLPAEREIAEKMGVSRPSVREAFSALQIAGIIESRSGDGTYIKDSGSWSSMESQALEILEQDEDPYAVWEAREGIECGIVKIAVQNATAEDIKRMEKYLKQMQNAVEEQDYNKYFKSDRDFHLSIGEATHNPFIKQTILTLVNVMKQRLWQGIKQKYYLEGEGNIKESFENHQKILEVIKERNQEKAVKMMLNHFDELREHLEQ